MKKTTKVVSAAMLMAITGYGAWSLYKRYNPNCMDDMTDALNKISKDVEKSLDDIVK